MFIAWATVEVNDVYLQECRKHHRKEVAETLAIHAVCVAATNLKQGDYKFVSLVSEEES